MTLSTGTKLSHYEITSQIGKGGMGEVYQAKDTKLGRDVAIKVLPEEFARDVDRVARFQREAKLLASLNHPNIAAIYGLEESDDTHFLVMELIEGDTLADRLKRDPIPVEEALKLALQIAEALEAAHEKGVIHRDLKPANIKVTPDGKVKILDFGLAKAFTGDQGEVNLADSPTLSVAATQKGVILGTAAYMSPEQARGEMVDRKADIWAFGVVLFEMLTGRQVFTGRTVSDTLASVLAREPEWNGLTPNLHPRIRFLLERCLKKEPKNRYSSISDARVDIDETLADPSGVLAQPVFKEKSRTSVGVTLPWIIAALGIIITATAVWNLRSPEPRKVARFYYELPKGHKFAHTATPNLAVSPDGSQLAYSTSEGIYLRPMNEMNAKLVAGTEEITSQPFFSPDGKWIGYWSRDYQRLKKISIVGGIPQQLCEDPSPAYYDWAMDGKIYYSGALGIMRISENGGSPEILFEIKSEEAFFSPQLLPDGNSVMYTIDEGGKYQIAVQSLGSEDRKILLDGATARYLPTGHLVYLVGSDLKAVPFDIDRLELIGDAVTIVEDILVNGPPHFNISNSGTFAYMSNISTQRSLVWVDLDGKEEKLSAPPDYYLYPKVSPDGTRIALAIADSAGNQGIAIWNIMRGVMNRLPYSDAMNFLPHWASNGRDIVFGHMRGSNIGIYRMPSYGTGILEPLYIETGRQIFPSSLSESGNILLCQLQQIGIAIQDIGMLSMGENHEWKLLLQEDYNEDQPRLSPDEKWLAYTSNQSGKSEIYVRSFPDVDKWQEKISTNGGDSPLWSPNERELYYRNGDDVMAVTVETEPDFMPGKPRTLFQGAYYSEAPDWMSWDIHPDGKRFLMMREADPDSTEVTARPRINIVLNWSEELKQKVPGN